MSPWDTNDENMARSSHKFVHGGYYSSELSSDKALSALNISMATKTDNESVDAFRLPIVKMSHGVSGWMVMTPSTV